MLYDVLSYTITEWVALLVALLLVFFSSADRAFATRQTGSFRHFLAIVSVTVVSGLVLHSLERSGVPFAFVPHQILRCAYIILCAASLIMGSAYILSEIVDPVRHSRANRASMGILWAAFDVFCVFVLLNFRMETFFLLSPGGELLEVYFGWPAAILYGLDILMILACYLRYGREHSTVFRTSIQVLATLMISFSVLHTLSRRQPMTSLVLCLTALAIYVSFQRQRVNSDKLTGCGNRDALSARIGQRIHQDRPFTLVQVSLLRFRRINRRFGLHTGDQLLLQVANSLTAICPDASVYRFNGTDFIVFHDGGPDSRLELELQRLRKCFVKEWTADDCTTFLSASFAQASFPEAGSTAEEIITNLEFCQTKARTMEDRSLVVFNEQIRRDMLRREQLFEMINEGMQKDQFFLVYQPIYDPYHDRPCAAEALLRLRNANGEMVSPGVFIPAAEENGSIIPLTWMVLDKVCRFLQKNREMKLPAISINFSVQQFLDPAMCATIREHLERYQVQPQQIKIEITERVFSEDNDVISTNVRKLKEMGVGLYLDDFGTGYSNLASVIRLPFEVVKVDKTLLAGQQSEKPDILLHAVISGLKHIGAQVAIEGVETDEQSHRAQEMGVDRIQGFFYARPMEEACFVQHMSEHIPSDEYVFHSGRSA